MTARRIRVVFCWTEVSGYMAACWRAFAAIPGVDLHVVCLDSVSDNPLPFDIASVMTGLSHEVFDGRATTADRRLRSAVTEPRPDVVVLCGWMHRPYTQLIAAPDLAASRLLLGMDSPWSGSLAQRLAWLRLRHVAKRVDLVVTASEGSAEYARRIGVPDHRLRRGYYGFDYSRFADTASGRSTPWPRQFLFAGRYAPEKDLRTLIEAYTAYRSQVADPWGLTCCGTGPEAHRLTGRPGVLDLGFTEPDALPELFARHGAFVLPSRFEPWGVVLAEAAGAGLPVICSAACGASFDLVRSYYNGIVVPVGRPDALAAAFTWTHEHAAELPEMGRRGQTLAKAFSAEAWADRWYQYVLEAMSAEASRS